MELPQRKGEDRFLPAEQYRSLEQRIRAERGFADVRSLVISAFDRSTRMLPFVYMDWHMLPCGPRSIAGALHAVGLTKNRLVFQLWTPKLRPSLARIDGGPVDMLLVSAMKVHSAAAYGLIEDAWQAGDQRPLIIAGGPKAVYEPFDYFGLGPDGRIGADVVVTGEEPVLLELLSVLGDFGAGPGSMRSAFNRAREAGALGEIPGLVYQLDDRHDGLNLINTGPQRLLRDLDVLPLPSVGFRTLEPAHRRQTLAAAPLPLDRVCSRGSYIAVLITRGCKFHCPYCPIPAYNMRTFRRKSPQRVVEEFIDCKQNLNARYFFGADDNLFNSRKYVQELLETIARTQLGGKALGRQIRLATESTVIDLYKNRDLLPLARHGRAGINAIWLGVEDLSGTLIDKGQGAEMISELFAEMRRHEILPMVMLMHFDDQPLYSRTKLVGLIDQIRFLRQAGAIGLQCTITSPAVGSKMYAETVENGQMFESVGGKKVEDRQIDGNHVIACTRSDAWRMQLNMLRGYAAFYNLPNLFRTLQIRSRREAKKAIALQIWGMIALTKTVWQLKGYLWRLWRGRIKRASGWPETYRRGGSPYPELIDGKQPADTVRQEDQPQQRQNIEPAPAETGKQAMPAHPAQRPS